MAHLLFVFVIVFHTRSQSMPRWTSSACPSPLSALRTGIADCTITQNFTLFFDQRQPLHSNISKSSLPLGGHIARSGGKLIVFFFLVFCFVILFLVIALVLLCCSSSIQLTLPGMLQSHNAKHSPTIPNNELSGPNLAKSRLRNCA